MPQFQPYDLGRTLQTAETLETMRSNRATDQLQREYLRDVQMPNARAAATQAANQETRASQTHATQQPIEALKVLNAFAAEAAADPRAIQRWLPQLRQAGIPVEQLGPLDQATAKQLFDSTTQALQAYNTSSQPQQDTAALRELRAVQGMTPQQREQFFLIKRANPNLQLVDVPQSDGTVVKAVYDPATGGFANIGGSPMAGGVRPTPGVGTATAPLQPQPGSGVARAPEDAARAKALAEADATDLQNAPKRLQSANATINQINDNVLPVLDNIISNANSWTVGLLSAAQPRGSPAADLAANLSTIEADTAFNELQAMRDASPTGGALGAISEREIDLLASRRRALLQSQSPEQFKQNATALRQQYARSAQLAAQAKQVDQLKAQLFQLERRQPTPTERIQGVRNRIATIEDAWWDSLDAPADGLGGNTTGPVQIETDADYERLPSGTEFIGPDGRRRRKP